MSFEKSAATRRKFRLRGQWANLVLLTLVWVMLNGNASLLTLVSGFLIGLLILIVFPLPSIEWSGRLRPFGLVKLVVILLWELASASVRLARYAFSRDPQLRTAIIAVRLNSNNDLYQVGTGSILTIVPGSVVIDARRKTRTLYLHLFDTSLDKLKDEKRHALREESLILGAFASNAELRATEERREERAAELERAPKAARPTTGAGDQA
ncbi:Na+/H+ antiporter subunit E [Aestuariimicrobium sp. Y1814]|uniref:Na+/H+ antiporter subunit E n=1 Tax=Aestuariimicrobium sp. Y1814 TaxID=3418742 RepID=UPI003DA73C9E